MQTPYKAMSYSIKLKLEPRILNELVPVTREYSTCLQLSSSQDHIQEGEDRRRGGIKVFCLSRPSRIGNTVSSADTDDGERGKLGGRRNSLHTLVKIFSFPRRGAKDPIRACDAVVLPDEDNITTCAHIEKPTRPHGALRMTGVDRRGHFGIEATGEQSDEGNLENEYGVHMDLILALFYFN